MTKRELIRILEENPLPDDTTVCLKIDEQIRVLNVVRGVELNLHGTEDKVYAIWLQPE